MREFSSTEVSAEKSGKTPTQIENFTCLVLFALHATRKSVLLCAGANYVSMNEHSVVRQTAIAIAADARVLNNVLVSVLLIAGLVLILSTRAEWLYVT